MNIDVRKRIRKRKNQRSKEKEVPRASTIWRLPFLEENNLRKKVGDARNEKFAEGKTCLLQENLKGSKKEKNEPQ